MLVLPFFIYMWANGKAHMSIMFRLSDYISIRIPRTVFFYETYNNTIEQTTSHSIFWKLVKMFGCIAKQTRHRVYAFLNLLEQYGIVNIEWQWQNTVKRHIKCIHMSIKNLYSCLCVGGFRSWRYRRRRRRDVRLFRRCKIFKTIKMLWSKWFVFGDDWKHKWKYPRLKYPTVTSPSMVVVWQQTK